MKFLKSLIFISLSIILGCSTEEKPENKSTLKVGLSAEYPPFEFQQQGKIVGFDVDLLAALSKELGVEFAIQDMSFHSLISSLQTGKIDLLVTSMSITPERKKNVDFSIPYYQSSLTLLYSKNKGEPSFPLAKQKIGVQLGSTMEKWAKENTSKTDGSVIIALDTNPPLIEKLKLGQIDCIVIETSQAIEYCKKNAFIAYKNIGVVQDGYGIALAKGSPLLPQINKALEKLQENGTLAQIQEKWIAL